MKSRKVTEAGRAAAQDPKAALHGKWYQDACAAAFAMELIGERWTLPIVRELMLGGRRFSDIRASLPAISAKVLTERLESLESGGIVTRRAATAPLPVKLYELTDWGIGLEPVMAALGRWSMESPLHNPQLPLTPVSLMLSMRTMLESSKARDWQARVGLEVGSQRFIGRVGDGALAIARAGENAEPTDFVLRGPDANAFLPVLYGKRPLGSAGTRLEAEGDPALVQRFIDLFALPAKRRVAG